MKEIVNINLMTGMYNEWTGRMNIQVEENLDDLLERIKTNQQNGTTIMPVKDVHSSTKAININYITDIWV